MFVISDTHFFHDNIVGLCGRPENHNDLMIERWNETVGTDDLVLHLGDLTWKRGAAMSRFRREVAPKLNGVKLLVLGNHDVQRNRGKRRDVRDPQGHGIATAPALAQRYHAHGTERAYFADCGFSIVDPFSLHLDGLLVTFAHHPARVLHDGHVHVHGHIHNNGYGEFGQPAPDFPNNVNVSVEVIDYRPQRLLDVLGRAG
jgi:calcineurin-like phosphoesterase family protein